MRSGRSSQQGTLTRQVWQHAYSDWHEAGHAGSCRATHQGGNGGGVVHIVRCALQLVHALADVPVRSKLRRCLLLIRQGAALTGNVLFLFLVLIVLGCTR